MVARSGLFDFAAVHLEFNYEFTFHFLFFFLVGAFLWVGLIGKEVHLSVGQSIAG